MLVFAAGIPPSTRAQTADEAAARLATSAQTPDEAAIQKVVLKGYEAYAKKDAAALFSLFSERSPHLPAFKLFIRQDFAGNEKVKIEGIRVSLVRPVHVEGDRATARAHIEMHAVDTDTGRVAEGFEEMDHTFRFVREGEVWKLWQFVDTGEELAGDLLAAGTDEERAAVLAAKGEPITGGLLNGLVNQGQKFLEQRGDYAQATTIFSITLKAAERVNNLSGIGNALVGLGDVYSAQGDYVRAADNYQKVLKLAEGFGSKDGVAAVSVKMGNIHYQQGNFAQAMEYYQRSVKAYEELGSKLEIGYPLLNVGNAYFSLGEYAQALDYYQRSLRIVEPMLMLDKSATAYTAYLLNRLGDVYAAQGDHARALDSYRRSLKLYEELGNKAQTASALNGTANVRYAQGAYAEAAELSSRAAELAGASYTPEVLWQALTSLGRARLKLNQADAARQAFSDAVSVVEKLRGQVAGSEQDRQLFFEGRVAPYNAMVELLVALHDPAGAFLYAERAKGRMLLDVLRNGRADITKTMTPEEQAREKVLNASIVALNSRLGPESLGRQADKASAPALESRLQKARLEYEAFQTRAYAAHPGLKLQRGEAGALSAVEAGALIPDGETALLEYVVAPEKTLLFVLSRGGKVDRGRAGSVELKAYEIPVKAQDLARRVEDFRQRLAHNSLDFKEPARQLYDLLLKPAQKELEGKTTVCIVPAGQLWELPFQALLSRPDRYFLEDHALFYVPSLSVLREMKRKESAPHAVTSGGRANPARTPMMKVSSAPTPATPVLLAVGNPALSDDLPSRSKSSDRDLSSGALPEAEREVRTLGEIYGERDSRILTGAAAREETVKAEAWKYRILHFATHGTLDNHNPLYSRLLLASSGEGEDGFLEAREIMKLDFHADLAVLSACQTARGRVGAGEGLIGMSWALFIAGVSTTVASQWKVDAASTAGLMVEFHRRLRGSKDGLRVGKAEALRQAALKLMSEPKYRHPFYWSGFVVVGDGM